MRQPTEITLLTQAACGYCEHAKKVLSRVGEDHPLPVTEIDLGTPERKRLAERARA